MTQEPLYRWLVPRVVAPLGERLGRPVWTMARRLAELQWRSPEELEAHAASLLQALLAHATRQVPYYRDLFARAGLDPRDIRSVRDLAHVPVTTKVELRAGFPERTTAHNISESRRQKMMTSGSTGLPFEFYWDRRASSVLGGTYLFWLDWAGTAIWHTRVVIASPSYFYNSVSPPRPLRELAMRVITGERSVSLSSDQLTPVRFRALVNEATRRGPYFIRGYPRAIAGLAAELSEEGVPLASDPRAVITFAETSTPANVAAIRQMFRCQVVNYYSAWEVPQMAQTCPDNPEVLHVNPERVILRVVRPDGSDAASGETGRIVVTDLANYVMPFINYSAGDQAVAGARCPCGRGLPTLARLEGRDSEVIRTPQGREISGVILGQFLAFVVGIIPYVWEYQAIQTAPDAVTLRIVPTPRFRPELAVRLQQELESFLGSGVEAAVELVDRIPLEPSGKRLIIKFEARHGAGASAST
jgi:phenylacetate-CoA ligase